MVIFQTDRLRVRPYTVIDQLSFFLLNGNEAVVRFIRPAKDRAACNDFLDQIILDYSKNPWSGRWAVEERERGNFVGSFALIPVEGKDQMQIGYALLPEFWGMGFATELAKSGLQYVKAFTEIDPIYAYARQENHSSLKVLQKAGMLEFIRFTENGQKLVGFRLSRQELGGLSSSESLHSNESRPA